METLKKTVTDECSKMNSWVNYKTLLLHNSIHVYTHIYSGDYMGEIGKDRQERGESKYSSLKTHYIHNIMFKKYVYLIF